MRVSFNKVLNDFYPLCREPIKPFLDHKLFRRNSGLILQNSFRQRTATDYEVELLITKGMEIDYNMISLKTLKRFNAH